MSKPNLSDNDLKQMDEAWQVAQPEPVMRGLLGRALEDLRAARDRLYQTPKNSSRPSVTVFLGLALSPALVDQTVHQAARSAGTG